VAHGNWPTAAAIGGASALKQAAQHPGGFFMDL
jgi:hypothetical protein